MWVQFGEMEILADDIVKFAEGMREVEGNDVELHEDKGAPHDILLLGAMLVSRIRRRIWRGPWESG